MSSMPVRVPADSPHHQAVLDLPRRLTLVGEGFSHFLEFLMPGVRSEFLDLSDLDLGPMLDSVYRRDEEADAVTRAIHRTHGEARRQFELALEHGIAAVPEAIPEIVAFFETVDPVPPEIDLDKVEIGVAALRRIDPVTMTAAGWVTGFLLAAILPNTAQALVETKRTIKDPGHRAVETGAYVMTTLRPGGYTRFAEGAKTATRLRIMHSAIRLRLEKKGGWDETALGAPASIADTLGGAFPHSLWLRLCAERLGYEFSAEEREGIAHFTALAAYRHGIPVDMIPFTEAEQRLTTYVALRSANMSTAPEATRVLMPPMVSLELPVVPASLRPAAAGVINAFAHRALGRELCAATGIPNSPARVLLPVLSTLIKISERARRVPPYGRAVQRLGDALHRNTYPRVFTIRGDAAAHFQKLETTS
ncbi:oxygenase MpaB family protein [Nocardia aobensis]|uniref:Oxygenase MpaB family protein n=1 Tax=Nocardia aobensis TaxID=257277 RepID=A0ABW6NZD9_9NOCA